MRFSDEGLRTSAISVHEKVAMTSFAHRLPRRLAAVLESAVGFSRYCFQATTSDITGTSVAPM